MPFALKKRDKQKRREEKFALAIGLKYANDWKDHWKDHQALIDKEDMNTKFLSIDNRLESYFATINRKKNVRKLLDIGCGLAFVPEMFQRKYNTKLYLLDGDSETNDKLKFRDVSFGQASSFKYYNEKSYLMKSYFERELDFEFIDADRPIIDVKIKFDIITSFKSCGFHYPLSSYKTLIRRHSYKKTKLFFDLRKGSIPGDVIINDILFEDAKSILADIKFK